MAAAWVIMIAHVERARHDLTLVTDRTIPAWVDGMIYGTVIIFWSFAVVQIVYQSLPPGFYWGARAARARAARTRAARVCDRARARACVCVRRLGDRLLHPVSDGKALPRTLFAREHTHDRRDRRAVARARRSVSAKYKQYRSIMFKNIIVRKRISTHTHTGGG